MPTVFVCSRITGGHRRAGKFIPDTQTELEVTDQELERLKSDKGIMVMVKAEEPAEPETPPADPQKPTPETKPAAKDAPPADPPKAKK